MQIEFTDNSRLILNLTQIAKIVRNTAAAAVEPYTFIIISTVARCMRSSQVAIAAYESVDLALASSEPLR